MSEGDNGGRVPSAAAQNSSVAETAGDISTDELVGRRALLSRVSANTTGDSTPVPQNAVGGVSSDKGYTRGHSSAATESAASRSNTQQSTPPAQSGGTSGGGGGSVHRPASKSRPINPNVPPISHSLGNAAPLGIAAGSTTRGGLILPSLSTIDSGTLTGLLPPSSNAPHHSLPRTLTVTSSSVPVTSPEGGRLLESVMTEVENEVMAPQLFHCDSCKRDISNVFRLKCAVCQDYDLCVECFCRGAETGSHSNDHDYIPIGRNDFPLFDADWTAEEELALLEGVSKYGFGNWKDVANLVMPAATTRVKSKEECEKHYYSTYVNRKRYLEPLPNFGDVTISSADRASLAQRDRSKDHDDNDEEIGDAAAPPVSSVGQKTVTHRASAAATAAPGTGIVGYMPLRGDFDVEYDNDAELIIADMEFREGESAQHREIKLRVLDIYNHKLDDRIMRKQVVVYKRLLDTRRHFLVDRRRTKEEKDLYSLLEPLARFDIGVDFERVVSLFVSERRIKERLKKIQEWRSLGLKTLKDVRDYEELKTRGSASGKAAAVLAEIHAEVCNKESPPPINAKPVQDAGLQGTPAAEHIGARFCTEKELSFCEALQIPPLYYLAAKHALMRSASEKSDGAALEFKKTLRLDGRRVGSLFDLVLHTDTNIPHPEMAQLLSPESEMVVKSLMASDLGTLQSAIERIKVSRNSVPDVEIETEVSQKTLDALAREVKKESGGESVIQSGFFQSGQNAADSSGRLGRSRGSGRFATTTEGMKKKRSQKDGSRSKHTRKQKESLTTKGSCQLDAEEVEGEVATVTSGTEASGSGGGEDYDDDDDVDEEEDEEEDDEEEDDDEDDVDDDDDDEEDDEEEDEEDEEADEDGEVGDDIAEDGGDAADGEGKDDADADAEVAEERTRSPLKRHSGVDDEDLPQDEKDGTPAAASVSAGEMADHDMVESTNTTTKARMGVTAETGQSRRKNSGANSARTRNASSPSNTARESGKRTRRKKR